MERYIKKNGEIYWFGRKIHCHVDSFENIGGAYSRDENHVSYAGWLKKIIDVRTFTVLGGAYGVDSKYVYYEGNRFPKPNPKTVSYVGDGCIKDNLSIFIGKCLVKDADSQSFERLNHCYSRDCNRAYYHNKVIKHADPNSFHPLGDQFGIYAKDRKSAFYCGRLIKGADIETFLVVSHNQARDKYHIYDGLKEV